MSGDAALTVASYNVHGFTGRDGQFNPARIAEVIEHLDADIIALQEVEHREVAGVPIADWLADRLGVHAVRGDTFRRGLHDYGNLVLTRLPPDKVIRHDLSVPRREPRGAIEVHITLPCGRWRIIGTHLGLRARERRIQMARLAALADAAGDDPVVVAADFNEWRPMFRPERRLGRGFVAGPARATFPATRPAIGLDRICVRPAAALVRARAMSDRDARTASDHLPIVATLRWPVGRPNP